jgi:diguanylate cyclase (GGDEF)-like protein
MTATAATETAARRAALLFLVAGLLALANLGQAQAHQRLAAALLGVGDLAIAAGLRWLPWRRWPQQSTLVVVPLTLTVACMFVLIDAFAGGTYPLVFVLMYVWIGLSHPPRTGLAVAPLVAVGYVAGPLLHGGDQVTVASVTMAVPVAVLVGEVIARTVTRLERARARADLRSRLLEGIAGAARAMNTLDADRIAAALVAATLEIPIGIRCAAVFAREPGQAGTSVLFADGRGVDRLLRADPVVRSLVLDAFLGAPAGPGPSPLGAAAFPLRSGDEVVAALVVVSREPQPGGGIEVLEALTAQAGAALGNARRFASERDRVQELAEATTRDPLTGLGNRLHGANLLGGLQPGDGVLLLDLDHFKQVNDSDGHAGGDDVLRRLGKYLRGALRDEDTARYGGEEFLVVLKGAGEGSEQVAERLNEGWRGLAPRTTLSIGTAVHRPGDTSAQTLARADAALYEAKRSGRDRVCTGG